MYAHLSVCLPRMTGTDRQANKQTDEQTDITPTPSPYLPVFLGRCCYPECYRPTSCSTSRADAPAGGWGSWLQASGGHRSTVAHRSHRHPSNDTAVHTMAGMFDPPQGAYR